VKKMIFAVTIVLALALTAAAEQAKPLPSQHLAGNASKPAVIPVGVPAAAPPALCNPCLFYGGDIDVNDFNAAGMSDENTLNIPGSSTYSSIIFPFVAAVKGAVINVQSSAAFDPKVATYDIRTGMTDGNGGTEIQSGTVPAQVQATGRNFLGLNEYTISVHFHAVTFQPGVQYEINVLPQCLNGGSDGSCGQPGSFFITRTFVSNTTTGINSVNGNFQPQGQMFLNAAFFGFSYANWCDAALGFNSSQCAFMSYGLIGTAE
jgi:hypothetical protein